MTIFSGALSHIEFVSTRKSDKEVLFFKCGTHLHMDEYRCEFWVNYSEQLKYVYCGETDAWHTYTNINPFECDKYFIAVTKILYYWRKYGKITKLKPDNAFVLLHHANKCINKLFESSDIIGHVKSYLQQSRVILTRKKIGLLMLRRFEEEHSQLIGPVRVSWDHSSQVTARATASWYFTMKRICEERRIRESF
jgi:hypothetical protein